MYNQLIMAITHATRVTVSGIMMIINIVLSIVLIVLILMQKGNTSNVGAITGGSSDTYYGKNKARTTDSRLKLWTAILGITIGIIAIIFFIFAPIKAN